MWPPNNPDIKSADYCIWGVMQEQVHHMTILDVAKLWQRLMNTWAGFQQSAIDETTDQWQEIRWLCLYTSRSFQTDDLM